MRCSRWPRPSSRCPCTCCSTPARATTGHCAASAVPGATGPGTSACPPRPTTSWSSGVAAAASSGPAQGLGQKHVLQLASQGARPYSDRFTAAEQRRSVGPHRSRCQHTWKRTHRWERRIARSTEASATPWRPPSRWRRSRCSSPCSASGSTAASAPGRLDADADPVRDRRTGRRSPVQGEMEDEEARRPTWKR